ncbi:hypothetical protein P154DRAFT_619681 [Amniculicola lignicola CBS 123094]|uniref:Mediator of RNA polymerase II transcription subunit 11 n=1 Tax=Amniculicola lignicola CBS 123094 TaxID=1392246 RepID=A0A6A5WJ64_9PLEO|nr:hypothetical protein P154DRAFT_619681 [Amniculicola lignicola CBS 123094]
MANPETDQPYRIIAASHIRELSIINETLPPILTHSATCISLLTTRPILSKSSLDSPQHRRATLQASSSTFFSLVNNLTPALKAQVDALEAQFIIPEKAAAKKRVTAAAPVIHGVTGQVAVGGPGQGHGAGHEGDMEDRITNEGLGEWDVGVLNARAGVRQVGALEEVLERVEGVLGGMVREEEG